MSDLNMSHEKMSDFVSIPLFGFTVVIKPRKLDPENHWNTLIINHKKMMSDLIMSLKYFNNHKKMMSDLIMSCQRVSDLVSPSLVE